MHIDLLLAKMLQGYEIVRRNDMTGVLTKICTKCGEEKPATTEFFHRGRGGKYGLTSECKKCRQKYRNENRERIREYNKQYYIGHPDEIKEHTGEYQDVIKQLVIDHYGHACKVCGEARLVFLNIDHIDSGGRKHREEVGRGGNFYLMLVREGFPPGYQVLCWNHNMLSYLERVRANLSTSPLAITARRHLLKLKQLIVSHYGGRCACCGQTNIDLLCIDHIHGGGCKHRRATGIKCGAEFYRQIRNDGFPNDYQVLCYNCGRSVNGGVCPHEAMTSAAPSNR